MLVDLFGGPATPGFAAAFRLAAIVSLLAPSGPRPVAAPPRVGAVRVAGLAASVPSAALPLRDLCAGLVRAVTGWPGRSRDD
ncbi:hypothetical protein RND61_09740 [Streptomyces sp. TRM76323]|uniref:Secreted protein n=1 Tax=Streptomyces tamarix TaxID=3078565 RepID=A0ABU3QHV6_9ACTN|nr:hypothetical protein [Streptomyces tamarix]MDT9682352.1 hypothetical protein [Streptomyces tamarix]